MKFEIGDTVINTITKQVYTVVATDEQPYITLNPKREVDDNGDKEPITVHQDFLELA